MLIFSKFIDHLEAFFIKIERLNILKINILFTNHKILVFSEYKKEFRGFVTLKYSKLAKYNIGISFKEKFKIFLGICHAD